MFPDNDIQKELTMKREKVFKNGLIGKLDKDNPIVIYCNEQDKKKKRGKFLFKCCLGCKHNPIKI